MEKYLKQRTFFETCVTEDVSAARQNKGPFLYIPWLKVACIAINPVHQTANTGFLDWDNED